MPIESPTPSNVVTFNKHGLHLRWPRIWIIILGIILIFLCLCIAGMEVGHTIFDLRRSTAFGGFIVFLPLLACAIVVLITAFKPRLLLLRIAMILCFLMIILCLALIAYDILVLIDPTRCFFLNCNDAIVNASNSTTNITVTGWPLNITLPTYFQTNMNAKRIFQGIQILLACLFILFSALYILTYFIYRRINLHQKSIYNANHRTFISQETVRTSAKPSNHIVQSQSNYNHGHLVTMYMIDGRVTPEMKYHSTTATPVVVRALVPKQIKKTMVRRPRANSVTYDRICTRCMKEPRIVLTTNLERQNYFSHLCVSCNNELLNYRRKPTSTRSSVPRKWKP